jgi:hypothetical protein
MLLYGRFRENIYCSEPWRKTYLFYLTPLMFQSIPDKYQHPPISWAVYPVASPNGTMLVQRGWCPDHDLDYGAASSHKFWD